MDLPKLLSGNIILVVLVLASQVVCGQVEIKGTVYDRSQLYTLAGVSVMGTSGAGTMTDSLGRYRIRLASGDSLYFSYLGKFTSKFPVKDIPVGYAFDMSLQVGIDTLPSVFVRPKDYRQDSLANREEYRKVFDYSPNYLNNMKMERRGGMGMGFNLDLLFDAKKNRQLLTLRNRLEWEERENYVDHRFTRSLVRKITGLQPPAIDTFMRMYRPSYELIQSCETEYEFYKYIFDWGKTFSEAWKEEHPE
jgi:hypothetical protein